MRAALRDARIARARETGRTKLPSDRTPLRKFWRWFGKWVERTPAMPTKPQHLPVVGGVEYVKTRPERRKRPHPFSAKARRGRSTLEIMRRKLNGERAH